MLYKYCNLRGFDILLKKRLKASRIKSFNDPFELVIGIDSKNAFENIRAECQEDPTLLDMWSNFFRNRGIPFEENNADDLIRKIADFQVSDLGRVSNDIRDSWDQKMGISCLSERNDIIQMWAHYADSHQGIVIGMDEKEIATDARKFVKVIYHGSMSCLPAIASSKNLNRLEPYLDQVLKRKEERWKYEEEVRLYVNLDEQDHDGNYYVDLPASCFKEVYLGLRVHETTRFIADAIKNKAEFAHLKIFEMKQSLDEYKLVPKQIA